MMSIQKRLAFAVFIGVFATACANGGGAPSPAAGQLVTGQLALATFPGSVSAVNVTDAKGVVSQSSVAADGGFALEIAPGSGYRVEFLAGSETVGLIFPQQDGSRSTFTIASGGASFDVGTVRYVGDPKTQEYLVKSAGSSSTTGTVDAPLPGNGEQDGDSDEVECEDGVDPNTGSICVEDDDSQRAGICEPDTDDIDCEDGFDANTGTACAEDDDGEEEADDDAADTDDIDCEDGFDANTGVACAEDDDGEEEADLPAKAAVGDQFVSLTVAHGLVELRRAEHPSMLLAAGERWVAVATAEGTGVRHRHAVRKHGAVKRGLKKSRGEDSQGGNIRKPVGTEERNLVEGWEALRTKDFRPAAQAFGRVDSGDGPLAEDAAFWRAVALDRAGRGGEARQGLEDFIGRYGKSARLGEARAMLGWMHLEKGNIDGAWALFTEALNDRSGAVLKSAADGIAAIQALRSKATD
jgi:hypothetical protein